MFFQRQPARELNYQEENELLEQFFIHDGQIRDFLINCRILLHNQPKNRRTSLNNLNNYIREKFAPQLLDSYEKKFLVKLSTNFREALEKTLINTIAQREFTDDKIIRIHKNIIEIIVPLLSFQASKGILLTEKEQILTFAAQIDGFLTSDVKKIIEAQWAELDKYHENYYAQHSQISLFYPSIALGVFLWFAEILSVSWVALAVVILNAPQLWMHFISIIGIALSIEVSDKILELHHCLYALDKIEPVKENKQVKGREYERVLPLKLTFSAIPALVFPTSVADSSKSETRPPPPKTHKRKHATQNQCSIGPSASAPVLIQPVIDFSEILGYHAQYDPTSKDNKTLFPIERSSLRDTFYVTINPALELEMSHLEWEKFNTLLKQVKFTEGGEGIKSVGQHIEDPETGTKLLCYELRALGLLHGNTRLLGVVRGTKMIEGKSRCVIEFNTYCDQAHQPGKLARYIRHMPATINRSMGTSK